MTKSDKIILDLCGGTGAWSKPYKEAGYNVNVITLPKYDITKWQLDTSNIIIFRGKPDIYFYPEKIYGILAAPPCTEFSIAKNHKLPRDLDGAMEIVETCESIIEIAKPTFWALENPVGYIKNFLGKPNLSFQPYEFGDAWCKRTQIWGKFNIPVKIHTWEEVKKIPELYIRPGRRRPSIAFCHKSHQKYMDSIKDFKISTDAEFRAITPQGFAQAFYEANK
jgi:site-specific DNA-cytosine methylase